MYEIRLLPKARDDIIMVVNYISEDNIFYANMVQDYIYKSIYLLGDFPYLGKEIDKIYRQIVESKYKFKIVYKFEGDTIYIVSIFREQNSWN